MENKINISPFLYIGNRYKINISLFYFCAYETGKKEMEMCFNKTRAI
jgi:hypothetical protein